MIVTITPTVMGGTVLRRYPTDDPERAVGLPLVSVSRNRIEARDEGEVPEVVQQGAIAAFAELRRDRLADVRRYATHYRTIRSGLVPITKAGD